MDLITFLLESPLNQLTFGVMGLMFLETIAVIIWTERLRREVLATSRYLPNATAQLEPRITLFMRERVGRARDLLDTLEEAGPLMGLLCTFLAFTVALPGFWENLQNDPNVFFAKIGMAMGTSVIGLTIKLTAFVQGKRLDAEIHALSGQMADMKAVYLETGGAV